MAEIVKETITTQPDNTIPAQSTVVNVPTEVKVSNTQQFEYVVYFLTGIIEVLLAFRFILKLTGASTLSSFVSFIYGITGLFIAPFEGIFRRGISQGIETASVFEPANLVAMAVYALLAWGIVAFGRILAGKQKLE